MSWRIRRTGADYPWWQGPLTAVVWVGFVTAALLLLTLPPLGIASVLLAVCAIVGIAFGVDWARRRR